MLVLILWLVLGTTEVKYKQDNNTPMEEWFIREYGVHNTLN